MHDNSVHMRAERLRGLCDHLRIFPTSEEAVEAVDTMMRKDAGGVLAFANAHAFNLAWENPQFAHDLLASELVLRDGKGVEILLRRKGIAPGANLNGTDLIPEILRHHSDARLAVFGTREPWLGDARDRLNHGGARIVSAVDGFQGDQTYVDICNKQRPEIVLLAMGMPRQERVAQRLMQECIQRPRLIICGGAIVDFIAGRHSRAPALLRNAGLEWLYRLALEPRRLFRRYVIGNVQFLRRLKHVERQETNP